VVPEILRFLIENDEPEHYKSLTPSKIVRRDNPKLFNSFESDPPEGAIGHFCRWAAQSYYTVYNRRATYVAARRRNGKGTYWRLINSGYGSYPYLGDKSTTPAGDSIVMPEPS
jgi:hypothetical protein